MKKLVVLAILALGFLASTPVNGHIIPLPECNPCPLAR